MPALKKTAAVIGGGPAGLMAAEVLASAGVTVDLYDAMPSVGRKFLLAGIGGMNITHSEPFDDVVARYRERAPVIRKLLERFGPDELRRWIHNLGIETFVGTSGRVFPKEMKAAPLLRTWLHRLRESGVKIHTRHRWQGWNASGDLVFHAQDQQYNANADTVVLALGGGSWPQLGSDAAWVSFLESKNVPVRKLQPSNVGFETAWSVHFRERFAGAPVKPVAMRVQGCDDFRKGEFIVTDWGIEGGLVYALSAPLRDAIATDGATDLVIDLLPDRSETELVRELARPRGKKSLSEHLRRRAGLHGVKAGLLRECTDIGGLDDMNSLAVRIKSLPLRLLRTRPLEEAISTAGGVMFESLNDELMLRELPGVFCAGEMLDWEAPTGGYLLTACFASGRAAGEGALHWLQQHDW